MSVTATTPSAKLEARDLLRLRHLLGAAIMPVALLSHPAMTSGSSGVAGIALAILAAGLIAPGVFARIGPVAWNRIGLAVVAIAVADLAVGIGTDRSQTVPTVVRAALMIAVLRSLQPRSRREDMQLLLLALFLGAVGGALSLSPVFALQALLFVPLAGGLLFLLDRAEAAPAVRATAEDWRDFRWGAFLGRLVRAAGRGGLLFFGSGLAATAVLSALIFVALPRYEIDNALPFLRTQGAGRTGFSDNVRFGDMNEILQDETPALRADTPGRERPSRAVYWRMIALDRYAGGFSLSEGAARDYRNNRGAGVEVRPRGDGARGASPGMRGDWTVFFEGNVSRYLPLPGIPSRVRFAQPQPWEWSDALRSLRLGRQPSDGVPMQTSILADTARFPASERERDAFADPAAAVASDRYPGTMLGTPDDAGSRRTLARIVGEIVRPGGGAVIFAGDAAAWLQRRHEYATTDSLAGAPAKPGEPDDYLVRWMDGAKATGWCEHFAGSLVLLARSAGYPARLVTGFAGGEWNEASGYLLVRMKHGHAWCEIYDREQGLWLRPDPTPVSRGGGPATGADAAGIQGMDGAQAFYDGVTMWWFRRVVNFDETDRRAAADSVVATVKAWRERIEALADTAKAALREAGRNLREHPAEVVVPVALIAAVWAARRAASGFFAERRLRRVRAAGDDDADIRRYRAKAGRLLPALVREGVDRASIVPVEILRFGRPSDWPEPEAALKAATAALRAARRRRGRSPR